MKKLFILLAAMLTFTSTAFAQLGSSASDLVFTPVTPCRIFDTRTSQGGTGPIAAGGTKNFLIWGVTSYAGQGGAASNCGITAGSNTAAVAVNFTVVSPATPGFITAFPFGTTRPTAATVNFNAGDVRGNFSIAKNAQGGASDLSVYSTSNVEVVGDVVGYYSRPVSAGSFVCTTTAGVTVAIAGSGAGTAFASACPANYVATGTNCRASSFDVFFAVSDNGQCSAKNTGGAAANITAESRCCQVPGR